MQEAVVMISTDFGGLRFELQASGSANLNIFSLVKEGLQVAEPF